MFRHLCAIFREHPLSLWVSWKSKMVVFYPYTVIVGGLCAPDVVVSHVALSGWGGTILEEALDLSSDRISNEWMNESFWRACVQEVF
jgi:hypothetical protein